MVEPAFVRRGHDVLILILILLLIFFLILIVILILSKVMPDAVGAPESYTRTRQIRNLTFRDIRRSVI
jgi:hypothetical protein